MTDPVKPHPALLDIVALSDAVRELGAAGLVAPRWRAAGGEAPSMARLAYAFALAPDVALAFVDVAPGATGGTVERYAIPFVLRDGVVREAVDGDGAWRALAVAIASGRTIPALTGHAPPEAAAADGGRVDAALVCRPSPGFGEAWSGSLDELGSAAERPLETPPGQGWATASAVIGQRLLVKLYRHVQPGLNPDLELTAYLSEEAGFTGVPRLAGWAEAVTRDGGVATVAMVEAFIAGAGDVRERTAEFLADLIAAPGSVSLEWATDVAADAGTLVAGLHAALATPPSDAPDLAPREATHDELKGWRREALRDLDRALEALGRVDVAAGEALRRDAPSVAACLSRFEAVAAAPMVIRIHGDLHLGRLLVADDGYRVAGFGGDPSRPIEERRRLECPLRDVAAVLWSLDQVARDARRRADRRAGGVVERPRLDVEAWIERARARFLAAYTEGLRRLAAPVALDRDLLEAFEVAGAIRELARESTLTPSGPWGSVDGLRRLLDRPG